MDPTNQSEKKQNLDLEKKRKRDKFLKNLRRAGLQLESDVMEEDKTRTVFIKLHAPWEIACYYAENLNFKKPLELNPTGHASNWSAGFLSCLRCPNIMDQVVPNQPSCYYNCDFKRSKLQKYLGWEDQDNFFKATERHLIAWEVLTSTFYGQKQKAEVGVENLLTLGIFTAAYPLHSGTEEVDVKGVEPEAMTKRQVLYQYWARWGVWYKYQPLDHIREYFGEKITLYFAWLGFYTAWLLPASIVGCLVFAYGLITYFLEWNVPALEACNSNTSFPMCPMCEAEFGCKVWYLNSTCMYAKLGYLFDNPATVFFAVFMSFWSVTFLEYWKRKNATLANDWDCRGYEEEEERIRPIFAAKAPEIKANPVTGVNEPYFDENKRRPRIVVGIVTVVLMIFVVIAGIIGVIAYRALVRIPLMKDTELKKFSGPIVSGSAAVINLIIIMALGNLYEKLAVTMTEWEMHRTQTEFEDQVALKSFIFQFVNFYSSIFYIGFFKGKFSGHPGNYHTFFGLRSEECGNGGCLIELAQQLFIIMVGKQMINNTKELLLPKLKGWLRRCSKGGLDSDGGSKPWVEQYKLIEDEGLFGEYLEMVLQYGFITMFVAAFPLAPLFALLNNWMEIRLDAHKYVCEVRRPVAQRAEDIGVWFSLLDFIAQLSVISNAFLVAFTSEFLPQLLYKSKHDWSIEGYTNFSLAYSPPGVYNETCRYQSFRDDKGHHNSFFWELLAIRLAFVICFEHVVFGVCRLIDAFVPDEPEELTLTIKRQQYLAKQALTESDPTALNTLKSLTEEAQL